MATSTSIGLDTPVVLRLLTGEPPDQARTALDTLAAAKIDGTVIFMSDVVVMEAYFALQTHYGIPKKEALAAIARMFNSGDIQPDPDGCAREILNECLNASSKPGFVDRMIHARYRSHGAKLLTFEKASAKLPGAEVL